MSEYQKLLAQKAALEQQAAALGQQIEEARRAERSAVLDQIKALMAEHGVTLAELGGAKKSGRPAKSAKPTRKVAAKYRDAASGNSWSGRGLQPNWLKAALAAGRKLEDFAV